MGTHDNAPGVPLLWGVGGVSSLSLYLPGRVPQCDREPGIYVETVGMEAHHGGLLASRRATTCIHIDNRYYVSLLTSAKRSA